MILRRTAIFASGALVYLGAAVAGTGGFHASDAPIFALLPMLWLHAIAPRGWPTRWSDLASPRMQGAVIGIYAAQLLVTDVCLFAGNHARLAWGFAPLWPHATGLALAAAGIAFVRIAAAGGSAAADDGDEADVLPLSRRRGSGPHDPETVAAAAILHLADVPAEGVPPAALRPLVDEVVRRGAAEALLAALAETPETHHPYLQTELMILLPDTGPARRLGTHRLRAAFERSLATESGRVIEGAASAALRALPGAPDLALALPPPDALRFRAQRLRPAAPVAAAALERLAAALEAPGGG